MNRARIKKLRVLITASMVLTACSSSESSSTSSVVPRTKNAALTMEVADCVADNIGPNGGFVLGTHDGKIVEGTPSKWATSVADAVQSQKAAIDYAASFSLNGKTGWSIPAVEVYQAVKGKIFERYGLSFYWSSTKWGPTMPILMRTNGNPDLKQSYYPSVDVVPLILTPTASAVCSAVPTTTSTSTTTSTTSTSTTTLAPPVTIAPSTTTTAPPLITTTSTTTTLLRTAIPSLTVNAFDNSSYALSAAQKLQLNKLGARLQAGDSVSCVAYQESNALNLLSRLTVKRSQSVCTYLSTRVRGLLVTPSAQFVPSAQVQISTAKPMQVRSSSTLLRKVVVTTKPRS